MASRQARASAATASPIMLKFVDTPRAMGLIISTCARIKLKLEYDGADGGNTLVLIATSLPMMPVAPRFFNKTKLKLLSGARAEEMSVLHDDSTTEYARRFTLPYWPASNSPQDWIVQRAALGPGDEVTLVQIQKGSPAHAYRELTPAGVQLAELNGPVDLGGSQQ